MTMYADASGDVEDPLALQTLRFDRLRERLRGHLGEAVARAPLRSLVIASDQHLPQRLLGRSVTEVVMQMTAAEILEIPGVGPTRLRRLLDVIERAVVRMEASRDSCSAYDAQLEMSDGLGGIIAVANTGEFDSEDDRSAWHASFEVLHRHRLEHLPIGMFADSIRDLPRALWEKPLAAFRELGPLGPVARKNVEHVVTKLASALNAVAPDTYAMVPVLPAVRQLTAWVEDVARLGGRPTRGEFIGGFCDPLLKQVEADFSVDVSTMCALKLGIRSDAETLESIGERFGVTRERIRQYLATVSETLRVRWPDGPYHVKGLLAVLNGSGARADVRDLAERVAKEMFDTTQASEAKTSEVVSEAWRTAGRQRLTPMNAEQMREWSARTLADIDPLVATQLIQSEFPSYGQDEFCVWFTDADNDRILLCLQASAQPRHLGEIVGEVILLNGGRRALELLTSAEPIRVPRNLAEKLGRDPRLVQLEDKRWLPAEACGFFRENGEWAIRLTTATNCRLPVKSVTIGQVLTFLVTGMLRRGIVDATSAGVHRFISEMLSQLFDAALPPLATPYVLAHMLVVHGGGVIQHMRRRRLHWEAAEEGLRALGKRLWVERVVMEAGMPMVVAELDTALREKYQDYADYVIQQVHYHHHSKDEDGGETASRVEFVTHLGVGVPVIIAPIDWRLDPKNPHVSPGVMQVVKHLRGRIEAGEVKPLSLRQTPWLESLVFSCE